MIEEHVIVHKNKMHDIEFPALIISTTRFKKSPRGGLLHNAAGQNTAGCLYFGNDHDDADDDTADDASADDADDDAGCSKKCEIPSVAIL